MRSSAVIIVLFASATASAQSAPEPDPTPSPSPSPSPSPDPSPPPTSETTTSVSPSGAVVVTTNVVTTPPPPPPPPTKSDDDGESPLLPAVGARTFYVALEVGQSNFGDADNIYGPGAGRGLTIGVGNFEFAFAQYDLPDRSMQFVNVNHADGIATTSTIGYRFGLIGGRWLQLTGLVGAGLVSRPQLVTPPVSPDDAAFGLTSDLEMQSQWGLAGLLGGGVQLLGLFYADVRIYPTAWSKVEGTRYEYVNGAPAQTAVTMDSSPGGIPITFSAGVQFGY